MITVTSFDPTLLYITLKWNIVTVNLSEFMKPGKVMVRIYDILLTESLLYMFHYDTLKRQLIKFI